MWRIVAYRHLPPCGGKIPNEVVPQYYSKKQYFKILIFVFEIKKSNPQDEKLMSLNLIITLVGRYFNQLDLADN